MELQEQVNTLTAQNKDLQSMLENINSEKVALDQMLVEALKNNLNAKKDVILKDAQINKLNTTIQSLNKEKEIYLTEIDKLKVCNNVSSDMPANS